jgi:sulfoxide reductase catalytic subunit YedY
MRIRNRRGWELPEREATPESVYLNRRHLMGGLIGAGAALTALGRLGPAQAQEAVNDPTVDLYPAARNTRYEGGRDLTEEKDAITYNNFYEFGSSKNIWRRAQEMPLRPWTVTIDGLVETPRTIDIDTLIRAMTLEERIYRLRCVESWAMTVPWTGFPLADLVRMAGPKPEAKYLLFETLADKETMPGLREPWYPWPYLEGLTIEEATNELALMVTGLYGKPAPQQNGAPLRLAVPWKYGFKSIKSIVRITFTDRRPVSFWEEIQPNEYGFWANVNPEVPHPRWSQATEQLLGESGRVPTKLYNGYEEFVAGLYADKPGEKLFM